LKKSVIKRPAPRRNKKEDEKNDDLAEESKEPPITFTLEELSNQ